MNDMEHGDVTAARLLSDLPAYGRWDNRPLNRQLRQLLAGLDEQTLMSLTAHAVGRIASGGERGRGRGLPV
jgi:hypothetical protein